VHRSPASHRDFRFAFHRDQVMTIVGLRPGRTKVRTDGVHTLADSVASISPLDSILERDVIVTPPIGRFRITPRPATMVAGDSAWFAVEVLDRRGRSVRGAPVDLLWGVVGSYSVSSAPNPVRVIFDKPGLYRFVATLGTHADTLHVDVRPAAAAP
jgi:hypothetical protein